MVSANGYVKMAKKGTIFMVVCIGLVATVQSVASLVQERRNLASEACTDDVGERQYYSDRRIDRLDQDQEQRLLLFNRVDRQGVEEAEEGRRMKVDHRGFERFVDATRREELSNREATDRVLVGRERREEGVTVTRRETERRENRLDERMENRRTDRRDERLQERLGEDHRWMDNGRNAARNAVRIFETTIVMNDESNRNFVKIVVKIAMKSGARIVVKIGWMNDERNVVSNFEATTETLNDKNVERTTEMNVVKIHVKTGEKSGAKIVVTIGWMNRKVVRTAERNVVKIAVKTELKTNGTTAMNDGRNDMKSSERVAVKNVEKFVGRMLVWAVARNEWRTDV
uniref:Uncharacterized protein n=1 Tax=Anopheles melas TaxID=34690 RepID=A0A182TMK6_9DIPT